MGCAEIDIESPVVDWSPKPKGCAGPQEEEYEQQPKTEGETSPKGPSTPKRETSFTKKFHAQQQKEIRTRTKPDEGTCANGNTETVEEKQIVSRPDGGGDMSLVRER